MQVTVPLGGTPKGRQELVRRVQHEMPCQYPVHNESSAHGADLRERMVRFGRNCSRMQGMGALRALCASADSPNAALPCVRPWDQFCNLAQGAGAVIKLVLIWRLRARVEMKLGVSVHEADEEADLRNLGPVRPKQARPVRAPANRRKPASSPELELNTAHASAQRQ